MPDLLVQLPSVGTAGTARGKPQVTRPHVAELEELVVSPLVLGWSDGGEWDVAWRQTLVKNLSVMVSHLHRAGIDQIFIDGSFADMSRKFPAMSGMNPTASPSSARPAFLMR